MSENNPAPVEHRSKRLTKHKKRKANYLLSIVKWIKKNPVKVMGIVFGAVLIYVTILFIIFSREEKKKTIQNVETETR